MKMWDFLKENMLKFPEQLVCENGAQMTYEELIVWAEQFSFNLKGLNSCAICCGSEMLSAMALLSCFAAGVTAVPMSMRYGARHCKKIMDTISPEAIITDSNGYIEVIGISDNQYVEPEEHPVLIMCTSGTTGKPKGAMLSERSVIVNVSDIAEYFDIGKNDAILIARPLYHCAVLTGEFLTALVKGSRIQFYSEKFNPSKMPELIFKYEITAFCGTPTLLGMMARFVRNSESLPLKYICISGECMGKEIGLYIAEVFKNCSIYHIYGLTEACPRVAYLPPNLFRSYPDFAGKPLKSVSIRVVNRDGVNCKPNEEGIIWVSGENVMLGYYQEPDKTKEVLKDGWLCTGDIGFLNDEGLLKIKGRNDDLIIKAGMNIYPAEIEAALKSSRLVKEVLAYGFEGRFGVQIGLKIVGDFGSVDEVRSLCAELLPAFQIPGHIEILSELPKNGSGKVIRKA